jgi:hypothetical protein
MSHIGLSFAEITDLLETYQRIGYFRQDIEAGLAFFSADACQIFGVDVTEGPISLTDIVRKLHPEDVELLTSTFETSARLKTGFDLACRVLKDAGGEKFIRMVGKFRPGASGEGEVAGLVYEFFERMQIVDFGDA